MYAYNEGGLPIAANDTRTQLDFNGIALLAEDSSLEGEEDLLNKLNAESELNYRAGGDRRIQAIIEHAFNGDMTFDEIMDSWNKAWSDAQSACGVEVHE